MSNNLNNVAGAQNLHFEKLITRRVTISTPCTKTSKNKPQKHLKLYQWKHCKQKKTCDFPNSRWSRNIFTLSQISRIVPFDEVVQLLQKSFGFDRLVPDYMCIFQDFRLTYLEKGKKGPWHRTDQWNRDAKNSQCEQDKNQGLKHSILFESDE